LFDVQVTYSGSEGSSVVLSGLSSDPGQGVIIAARDYERQFSAHFVSFLSHLQLSVLRTRIRRIRMFLGLLDPDPLVRGMAPDPSINKQK
jgi:hypothetical protein